MWLVTIAIMNLTLGLRSTLIEKIGKQATKSIHCMRGLEIYKARLVLFMLQHLARAAIMHVEIAV